MTTPEAQSLATLAMYPTDALSAALAAFLGEADLPGRYQHVVRQGRLVWLPVADVDTRGLT